MCVCVCVCAVSIMCVTMYNDISDYYKCYKAHLPFIHQPTGSHPQPSKVMKSPELHFFTKSLAKAAAATNDSICCQVTNLQILRNVIGHYFYKSTKVGSCIVHARIPMQI